MPSLMKVYQDICGENLITPARQKDIKTALTYLAASYDSTPEVLPMSENLEATYRHQMQTYFDAHPKGKSTIRNSMQAVGQFLKAAHQLTQTPLVPIAPPAIPRVMDARRHRLKTSPYGHFGWMTASRYRLTPKHWPGDIADQWHAYRLMRRHQIRATTLKKQTSELTSFVSYLCLTPDERLAKLPEHVYDKLHREDFHDDLLEITAPSVLTSWDELFQLSWVESFMTWHSWRIHTKEDASDRTMKPYQPSATGRYVAKLMSELAKLFERPEAPQLKTLMRKLSSHKKMHDKKASYHCFELGELEHAALGLMAEARRMHNGHDAKYPGARAARHFQIGLILALAWRNPMRARNWCEARIGTNLQKRNGQWRWRFEGKEMKVGMHGVSPNIFEPDVSPDVAPYLDEYLDDWRPKLPHATEDRHVFLSERGNPLTSNILLQELRAHVYRYTGKHLYTHLLRSLFISHHLTNGVDINSVAFALNDTPATVLKSYNELMEEKHRPIIYEANQRALANGNGHVWTPPNIPIIPKPMKSDPDQMNLI